MLLHRYCRRLKFKSLIKSCNILLGSLLAKCPTLCVKSLCMSCRRCNAKSFEYYLVENADVYSECIFVSLWSDGFDFDSKPLKVHPNETNNQVNVLFLWFAAIMTSLTLKPDSVSCWLHCLPVSLLCPDHSQTGCSSRHLQLPLSAVLVHSLNI